jgi:hypothetical protein
MYFQVFGNLGKIDGFNRCESFLVIRGQPSQPGLIVTVDRQVLCNTLDPIAGNKEFLRMAVELLVYGNGSVVDGLGLYHFVEAVKD